MITHCPSLVPHLQAELGDLALVAGLLALAAFILITVAGGFFAAAGGILIGTTSSALAGEQLVRQLVRRS